MDRYDHREALARVWDLVRRSNAYLDERAPWHMAKAAAGGDQDAAVALDTTLHQTLLAVRQLAMLLRPFIPQASRQILQSLNEDPDTPLAKLGADLTGRVIEKAPPLFPRLELA
jgi:methionyl-tRNA synthetase